MVSECSSTDESADTEERAHHAAITAYRLHETDGTKAETHTQEDVSHGDTATTNVGANLTERRPDMRDPLLDTLWTLSLDLGRGPLSRIELEVLMGRAHGFRRVTAELIRETLLSDARGVTDLR